MLSTFEAESSRLNKHAQPQVKKRCIPRDADVGMPPLCFPPDLAFVDFPVDLTLLSNFCDCFTLEHLRPSSCRRCGVDEQVATEAEAFKGRCPLSPTLPPPPPSPLPLLLFLWSPSSSYSSLWTSPPSFSPSLSPPI